MARETDQHRDTGDRHTAKTARPSSRLRYPQHSPGPATEIEENLPGLRSGSRRLGQPADTDVTVPLDCKPPNRARPPRSGIRVVAAEATAVSAPESGGCAVAPELRQTGLPDHAPENRPSYRC